MAGTMHSFKTGFVVEGVDLGDLGRAGDRLARQAMLGALQDFISDLLPLRFKPQQAVLGLRFARRDSGYAARKAKIGRGSVNLVFTGRLSRVAAGTARASVSRGRQAGETKGVVRFAIPPDMAKKIGAVKRFTINDVSRLARNAERGDQKSARLLQKAIESVQKVDIRAELRQISPVEREFIGRQMRVRLAALVKDHMRKRGSRKLPADFDLPEVMP